MRAAWYERKGPARDVLEIGEMPAPEAGPGEVRVRLAASGVNPADVKLRAGTSDYGFVFPRVIPNSDGGRQGGPGGRRGSIPHGSAGGSGSITASGSAGLSARRRNISPSTPGWFMRCLASLGLRKGRRWEFPR